MMVRRTYPGQRTLLLKANGKVDDVTMDLVDTNKTRSVESEKKLEFAVSNSSTYVERH